LDSDQTCMQQMGLVRGGYDKCSSNVGMEMKGMGREALLDGTKVTHLTQLKQ